MKRDAVTVRVLDRCEPHEARLIGTQWKPIFLPITPVEDQSFTVADNCDVPGRAHKMTPSGRQCQSRLNGVVVDENQIASILTKRHKEIYPPTGAEYSDSGRGAFVQPCDLDRNVAGQE